MTESAQRPACEALRSAAAPLRNGRESSNARATDEKNGGLGHRRCSVRNADGESVEVLKCVGPGDRAERSVQRVGQVGSTALFAWGAHERVTVKRG